MALSFMWDTAELINQQIKKPAPEPLPYVDPATMFTAQGPVGPQYSGAIPTPPSFSGSAGITANQPITPFGTALPAPPPVPPPAAAAPAPFPSPAGPVPQHVIESTLFGGGMPLQPGNLPPIAPNTLPPPPQPNPFEQAAAAILGGSMPWNQQGMYGPQQPSPEREYSALVQQAIRQGNNNVTVPPSIAMGLIGSQYNTPVFQPEGGMVDLGAGAIRPQSAAEILGPEATRWNAAGILTDAARRNVSEAQLPMGGMGGPPVVPFLQQERPSREDILNRSREVPLWERPDLYATMPDLIRGEQPRSGFSQFAGDVGNAALTALDAPREYVGAPLAGATLGRFANDEGRFSFDSVLGGLADTPRAMSVGSLGLAGAGITDLLRPGGYNDAREQSDRIRGNLPLGGQVAYDLVTDPLMYVGPGAARSIVQRAPRLAPVLGGTRNPLGALIEGVGPTRTLPTAIGAGLGAEAADRFGAPQIVGSLAGAVLGGAAVRPRAPMSAATDPTLPPRNAPQAPGAPRVEPTMRADVPAPEVPNIRPIVDTLTPGEMKTPRSQAFGLLRQYEGQMGLTGDRIKLQIAEGDDLLRQAGIQPGERTPEMEQLFRALHGEAEPPPQLRAVYDDVRRIMDAEEAATVAGDSRFIPISDDYFFRGWRRVPVEGGDGKVISSGGAFGSRQGFEKHRTDMSFDDLLRGTFADEDGIYKLEPISWDPYKMAGIRQVQGVLRREQEALLQKMRQLNIARPVTPGADIPQGWRIPRVGPAFEGRPYAFVPETEEILTNPARLGYQPAYAVPRQVAENLENIYGPRVDLGAVTVRDRDFDVANVIDKTTSGLKRTKLFGSLFQQVDFTTRTGAAGFGAALDALTRGRPVEAAAKLATIPRDVAMLVKSNVSPQQRRNLLKKVTSDQRVLPNSDVTWADIRKAGWSPEDITILRRNLFEDFAEAGERGSLTKPAKNRLSALNRALEAGLFDGVYPQAQSIAIEKFVLPYELAKHPDWTKQQIAAEVAKRTNEMFSTLSSSQQLIQNQYVRWFARQMIFSTNETESFLRQGAGLLRGGNQGLWAKFYLGAFLFLAATANAINFAVTGEFLEPGQYAPFEESEFGPMGFAYNSDFLAPDLGPIGRGGTNVSLDLVGQMDTVLSLIENPLEFFTARENVIPRALWNQRRGEDFYGRDITGGPMGGLVNRGRQLVTDFAPIGGGNIAEVARQTVPNAEILPEAEGRIGPVGAGIQATGLNVRAQNTRDLIDSSVQKWAEENGIEGVTSLDDLSPKQRKEFEESTPGLQEELRLRTEQSALAGNEGAVRRLETEKLRDEQLSQQMESDKLLQSGAKTAEQWREDRKQRQQYWRGRKDQVYAAAETPAERDAVDRYYRAIDSAVQADGTVDWDMVDGFMATMPAADRRFIEENTGLGGTAVEKDYLRDQKKIADSKYWDIPDALAKYYAEYVGIQATNRNELYSVVREGITRAAQEQYGLDPSKWEDRKIIEAWVDKELKPYTDWVSDERSEFRKQRDDINELLLKWDYKAPNQGDLATLWDDTVYTDGESEEDTE